MFEMHKPLFTFRVSDFNHLKTGTCGAYGQANSIPSKDLEGDVHQIVEELGLVQDGALRWNVDSRWLER